MPTSQSVPGAVTGAGAAPDESDCIWATGLTKRFPNAETPVFSGVELKVRKGEMLGLMGRSGSGKSTLLHILGGLDRNYQGTVSFWGQNLAALSDRALAQLRNRHVGFVFQSFHLLPYISCLDNVLLPNAFAQQPMQATQARDRACFLLEKVGLKDKQLRRPTELSGGQKQRVAIARALLFLPKVLLCDEPTGNLDDHTGQQIIELFSELHRDGQTLLLVTHEPRVAQATTRVVFLEKGCMTDRDQDATGGPMHNGTQT